MKLVSRCFYFLLVCCIHHVAKKAQQRHRNKQMLHLNLHCVKFNASYLLIALPSTSEILTQLHWHPDSNAPTCSGTSAALLYPKSTDQSNISEASLKASFPCAKSSLSLNTFIVTFPFVTFLILKPTVGIMSSLKCPDWKKKDTFLNWQLVQK